MKIETKKICLLAATRVGDRQGLAFNDKLYILNCEQENHGNVDADNLAMRMLKWVV